MAPETVIPSTATEVQSTPHAIPTEFKHPLDPLTPDEIAAVTFTVRSHVASKTEIKAIKFITCSLLPAPKKAVLAYLGISLTPGGKPEAPIPIVRKAEVDFLDIVNGHSYNVLLALGDGKWSIQAFERLSEGVQPQISVEELVACEKVVKNDPRVQQLAKEVGVLPEQIFCDGWAIGYDDRFPHTRRVQQAFVFARYSEHENLYAHPLDFIPVIDSNTDKVIHIDFPYHYKPSDEKGALTAQSAKFPELSEDSFAVANRPRIPPPKKSFDFLPDLMEKNEGGYKPRDDIKPLHIVQPEGVSFKMNGHELEWQNWKMHISFTHREGIALSTVTYNDNGEIRPILYRLSLAEMVVPYGAPEYPHPRKFAFDSGEYGMGTMANELSLGCDCVGQIHYLPGSYVAHDGSAVIVKNVICIHEEDSGVLWKHTDYRPGGRGQTVRRRRLVVSMVCTLANYEYIWNYQFYQDGTIELEARLTGILQVYVAQDGEKSKYGTLVAPNVNAQYHQHLFSVRVDPMIDGLNNTVIESDVLPIPEAETGSAENFAGNGFLTQETVLKKEAGRPYDWEKERRWRIVNPARQHYSSGKDVGYVVAMKGGITPMFARKDGWALKRAAFCNYPIWVCRDVEDEQGSRMWPAGKFVPQTRDSPADAIDSWVKGEQNIENEDILVYLTIGTTHIPRPEDWPVMPVEHLSITLKPQSFFTMNPSMDVPGTRDPRSVAAFSQDSSNNESQSNCHCD
ncbi:related to peroxisomal amine oxidase (copper-containing) [Armillaria ostoyae]|uniref:Amine oxidase n=1 Tax=Armillaria ostoyae TaxID=47428 RepID=A0A284S3S5_ARMOS|nr:related to peroxisomal amine oxidase (copper-containing) [Armillaria ostoyae]